MNKTTKTIVIVGSIILTLGIATGIILYFTNKTKTEQQEAERLEKEKLEKKRLADKQAIEDVTGEVPDGRAKFNSEGELSNPIDELTGKTLYPKPKALGGEGFTNVRSSAAVNDDRGWWDFFHNKLFGVADDQAIGTVISQTNSTHNGYSYRWFKVSIDPDNGQTEETGFVRADTVTFRTEEQ